MKKKLKLAIINRDSFPIERPSGATSYLVEMIDKLVENNVDIRLFSVKKMNQLDEYKYKKILIKKFSNTNLIKLKRDVDEFYPTKIILFSSVSSGTLLWFWWLAISFLLKKYSLYLYQVTNIVVLGNKLILYLLLERMKQIFITNICIFQKLKKFNKKKVLVYPGVNTQSNLFNIKNNKRIKTVGFFGHITYIKGVDVFIELAKKMPNIKFILAAGLSKRKNDVDFADIILSKAKRLKNVKHYGFVSSPLQLMKKCDVLLLPYRESGSILGVSQSGIEASAMGIPVIGTKNLAISPLIDATDYGLYGEDVLDFKNIIEGINERNELFSLSKKAKGAVAKYFDTSNNIKELLKGLNEKPV